MRVGHALALDALPDRGVLAVHGPQNSTHLARLDGDDAAGHYERFLVRKRDLLTCPDRRERRLPTGSTGSCDDHKVHLWVRRELHEPLRPRERPLHTTIAKTDASHPKPVRLLPKQRLATGGGERDGLEPLRMRRDNVERLGAYGASAA